MEGQHNPVLLTAIPSVSEAQLILGWSVAAQYANFDNICGRSRFSLVPVDKVADGLLEVCRIGLRNLQCSMLFLPLLSSFSGRSRLNF